MEDLNVWEERQGPEVPLTPPVPDPLPRRGYVLGALGAMVLAVGGGLGAIMAGGAAMANPPKPSPQQAQPVVTVPSATTPPVRATTEIQQPPKPAPTQPVVYVTRNVVEQVYVPDHQYVYLPGPTVYQTVPAPKTSAPLPSSAPSTTQPTTAPTTVGTTPPTTQPTTAPSTTTQPPSSAPSSQATTSTAPVGASPAPVSPLTP